MTWAWWRLKYLVLDKHKEQLRVGAFGLAVLLTLGSALLLVSEARERQQGGAEPVEAAFWVYLAMMVVSALISYALRPKPQDAKAQVAQTPQVEDGKSIERVYGTIWVDDSIVLGWKQISTEPIKKGGKK